MAQAMEVDELLFHENHGHNVLLMLNKTAAFKRNKDTEHGPVFSKEPMRPGRLYEVALEIVKIRCSVTCFGIVTKHPVTFCPSHDFDVSHPSVVYIDCDGVWLFGTWISELRDYLRNLPITSRVGLALKEDRTLHLYLNGIGMGPVARSIPDPCYFMFDLFARCDTISAQPVRVI